MEESCDPSVYLKIGIWVGRIILVMLPLSFFLAKQFWGEIFGGSFVGQVIYGRAPSLYSPGTRFSIPGDKIDALSGYLNFSLAVFSLGLLTVVIVSISVATWIVIPILIIPGGLKYLYDKNQKK